MGNSTLVRITKLVNTTKRTIRIRVIGEMHEKLSFMKLHPANQSTPTRPAHRNTIA